MKLPAEELEWSRALGREGLSGLSHHKNRPEVGLQRAGRFIHHLQSEHRDVSTHDQKVRTFFRSGNPTMVWEESTERCESSQAEEASSRLVFRGQDSSADSSHTTRPCSARFSTLVPLGSTFAGTGPTSEQRISSRDLPIGLHWPIAPHSPQTIEQGRWFQPVGEIFINKGQTNRSILREQKRGWHRQLP